MLCTVEKKNGNDQGTLPPSLNFYFIEGKKMLHTQKILLKHLSIKQTVTKSKGTEWGSDEQPSRKVLCFVLFAHWFAGLYCDGVSCSPGWPCPHSSAENACALLTSSLSLALLTSSLGLAGLEVWDAKPSVLFCKSFPPRSVAQVSSPGLTAYPRLGLHS